jgi:ribonuclease HI
MNNNPFISIAILLVNVFRLLTFLSELFTNIVNKCAINQICPVQPIVIYTDGAALGNPGPGGYAAVMMYGDKRKEIYGAFKLTTNNRMELLAVIRAMENIKARGIPVHVFSDSQYVCNAILKGWLFSWKKKGWTKVKNPDLWQRFLPLYEVLKPSFHWVKGHSGIPENERCDVLATAAAAQGPFDIDVWYEKNAAAPEGLL